MGHIDYIEILFSNKSYFSKYGLEKDAAIIGFLCWIPTPFLRRLEDRDRLSVKELAWELHTCDTEWDLMTKLCQARLRIYRALKKLEQV